MQGSHKKPSRHSHFFVIFYIHWCTYHTSLKVVRPQTVFIEAEPNLSFSVNTDLDLAFNNRNFFLLKFSIFIVKGLHTKLKGKPPKTYGTSIREIAKFFVDKKISVFGIRTGIGFKADPDPGKTLRSQKAEFLHENLYQLKVDNR